MWPMPLFLVQNLTEFLLDLVEDWVELGYIPAPYREVFYLSLGIARNTTPYN